MSPSAESWSYVYDALKGSSAASKQDQACFTPATPEVRSSSQHQRKPNSKLKQHKNTKNMDVNNNRWSCKACTFLNDSNEKICTMCSKSKDLPDIKNDALDASEESMGLECPKCTYLNSDEATECAMCRQTF
jgi:RNA polymerase subunit RPABC4/transcription elongation factor Spt4